MTEMWDQWKKGFYAWENVTAGYMEQVLQNPAVLGPSGQLLSSAMKARAKGEKAMAQFWGGWGLPTKRDQERSLHALNQIQSSLLDLEERMADIEAELGALKATRVAPAAPVLAAPAKKKAAKKKAAAKTGTAKKAAAKKSTAKKATAKKSPRAKSGSTEKE